MGLVDFRAKLDNPAVGRCVVVIQCGDGCTAGHTVDDSGIVWGQHLPTVGPVGFESVVAGGIV